MDGTFVVAVRGIDEDLLMMAIRKLGGEVIAGPLRLPVLSFEESPPGPVVHLGLVEQEAG